MMSAEEQLREFATDVCYQFGFRAKRNGRPVITTGGLSTLEEAFDIAGWDDPHYVDSEYAE